MNPTDLPPREAMEFDVVIVGAGPAGLAAAIRLKQLARDAAVVVVEKGSEVGAHILSGAVIDPIGLDRLLPGWREESDRPLTTEVTRDEFLYLGQKAEALGVEIYPGFPGAEVLVDGESRVVGVATGDLGIGKDGAPKD